MAMFLELDHYSTVAEQLKQARVPLREFKPSLHKGANKCTEEELIAQRVHLKEMFYLLKEEHNCIDHTLFTLLYANIINDEKFDDSNILSMELMRLYELRVVSVCKLQQVRTIKGRFDFPPQDERVNYFKRPAGLEESMMRPTLNVGNGDKLNLPYNAKLLTCKTDPETPREKSAYFRSIKLINKMEVLLKEIPILSYSPPACQCTKQGTASATSYRCHHCQKVIKEFYPCNTCDICVFCDIECYLFALDLYHRWECFALQRHMFSTNLIMAMRLMLIGMQTDIFKQKVVPKNKWMKYHNNCAYDRVMACRRDYILDKEEKSNEKIQHFANKLNGYSNYYTYVKKYYELKYLPVNWDGMKDDVDTIILDVTRMLGYLAHSTDLFQHLMNCSWKPDHVGVFDLQMYAGSMILRHYGEVLCNVIALPNLAMRPEKMEELEDGCTFVIGTNLGRFQHSCEPNAVCFMYNNEVIVRACEDIGRDDKVFINYFGVEDHLDPEVRTQLIQRMYFKCGCTKCNSMDYEYILGKTAFKCPECEMPLYGEATNLEFQCFSCDGYFDSKPFLAKENRVKDILENASKVSELLRAEKICNEIFKPYNPTYDKIYRNLHKIFVKIHDSANTQIYFKKYLNGTYYDLMHMSKSLAKFQFYFLQYFMDMCRNENFYENDILNMLIRALSDVKMVYMFYYNIEQVSIVTDLISGINPFTSIPVQHINMNGNGNLPLTHNTKDGNKLDNIEEED